MRLLLLAAVLALPVAAQQPSPNPTPPTRPPAPSGRITGTITCADTHRPARGAIVTATSLINLSVYSDVGRAQLDGSYTIDHLTPGTYLVIALMPGYSLPFDEQTLSQVGHSDNPEFMAALRRYGLVEVTSNEPAHFDISLVRGAAVSGRVLYSDGSPASQVSIWIEDTAHEISEEQAVGIEVFAKSILRSVYRHQIFTTDDQGRFRISGLNPGEYRVAAVQSSLQDPVNAPQGMQDLNLPGLASEPYPLRIYSGDTVHKAAAKKYSLRAGDEVTGIDITIPLESFHHVHGILHAVDGRVLTDADLTLVDTTDNSFRFYAKLHHDGTFDFPLVPAGTYRLEIPNANIGHPPRGFENEPRIAFRITNNFSPTTTTILVKDSDVTDIDIPMKEVPPAK